MKSSHFSGLQNMRKKVLKILFIMLLLSSIGCMKFALQLSPSLFPNLAVSFFEECDTELAKSSMPANLKMLEGLLKNDPDNREILSTLSMGFCGYSMLFIEGDSTERASELYLRARNYGIDALGFKKNDLNDMGPENFKLLLKNIGRRDLEALLWTAISWNAWINLNLDKPIALAQISLSQACLERLIEIDADYQHGLPYILMGISLSARPKMFGGEPDKARYYFEEALEVSDRKFFLAQYYYARYYSVMVQDRDLFYNLLEEIINGDPGELKELCLINSVVYDKAKELKGMVDDFFI